MDIEVRVTGAFDASHQVEGRERCRRNHGHHWTVMIGHRSRDGDASKGEDLRLALARLLVEWDHRDLNEMIPEFAETTPERLAVWIMERLLSVDSMLTIVEVSDGEIIAAVHREPPLR